jgi:ATP-dependent exoDNAse (exonuclease V) alpha subunit
LSVDPISLPMIDRGVFPTEVLRQNFPLPEPSNVADPVDERRVRAFTIQQLEKAATMGHTLLPREDVISHIRDLEMEPPCPVDGDMMVLAENTFDKVICKDQMADGKPAYQLEKLNQAGALIRKSVLNRLKGKRHQADINWRMRLDNIFKGEALSEDQQEDAARNEKAAALKELFSSRVSVLIGPAGTGKTTLLKVLCEEKSVKAGGILALAPTGKARVRFEQQTGIAGAKTIAQFLVPLDRYEPMTGVYRLSDRSPESVAKTVIIDEASMLTEEQLSAVLNALVGVERLVLVGDPRQLRRKAFFGYCGAHQGRKY